MFLLPEPETSVLLGMNSKRFGFFNKEILIADLKPDQYLVLCNK